MTEKEYNDTAVIIGTEMNKFADSKACNFGFITRGDSMYRIFVGGEIDNIAHGIVQGLLLICAQTGAGAEYVQGIADTVIGALEAEKGVLLQ